MDCDGYPCVPMPLMCTAFVPGQIDAAVAGISDPDSRAIATAEALYFRGQATLAAKTARPYLDATDPALRYSACFICGYASLSLNRIADARRCLTGILDTPADEESPAVHAVHILFASAASVLLHLPSPYSDEEFYPLAAHFHRTEKELCMDSNKRPDDMVRITTSELAQVFIDEQVAAIREQIGDKKVLLALSGGVDSSVVAALLIKAIGKQLICVHVNHGLMRKGESEQVVDVFKNQMDANLVYVDATDRFLDKLVDVEEPEAKRKIIGAEFIRVFEEEARKVGDEVSFLAQGTIYPDILESQDGVKAHHNVGGLPEDLQFELCEPVKLLYKDEVRVVGRELGLPENMVERQPFPGPGLGVRCLGAITRDRLEALREADAIVREEIDKAGLTIWQYFAVVPDFRATGVREGKRAYDWPCIIRCINTVDVMTAEVPELDWALLKRITARVTAEVPGICRVCYDLTPKPVGTVEWE